MGEVINRVALLRLALLPLLLLARVALGQSADLRWPETTSEAKPWTRWWWMGSAVRSEEHTSELQSLTNLVCRLLLEKKNKKERSARIRCLLLSDDIDG